MVGDGRTGCTAPAGGALIDETDDLSSAADVADELVEGAEEAYDRLPTAIRDDLRDLLREPRKPTTASRPTIGTVAGLAMGALSGHRRMTRDYSS